MILNLWLRNFRKEKDYNSSLMSPDLNPIENL